MTEIFEASKVKPKLCQAIFGKLLYGNLCYCFDSSICIESHLDDVLSLWFQILPLDLKDPKGMLIFKIWREVWR